MVFDILFFIRIPKADQAENCADDETYLNVYIFMIRIKFY